MTPNLPETQVGNLGGMSPQMSETKVDICGTPTTP